MFGRAHSGQWQREGFSELVLRLSRQGRVAQLELQGAENQSGTLEFRDGCVAAARLAATGAGVGGLAALRAFLSWPEGRYTVVRPPIPPLPAYAELERRSLQEQLREAAQEAGVRVFVRSPYTPVAPSVARTPFEAEVRARLLRVFGPISLPLLNDVLHGTLADASWVGLGQAQSLLEALRDDLPEDLHPQLEAQGIALLRWMEQNV